MIYIFGGHGYIGQYYQDFLTRCGVQFVAPRHSALNLSDKDKILDWIKLLNFTPASTDIIFYLASKTKASNWTDDDIHLPSREITNLASFFPNSRFIFTSSVDVYGRPQSLPLHESSAVSIQSNYAMSKFLAENTLRDVLPHSRQLILRLPGVYGGLNEEKSVFNRFVHQLLQEKPISVLNSSVLNLQRDWVFVGDLVRFLYLSSNLPVAGTFNFVTGKSKPIGAWIESIANELGIQVAYSFLDKEKDEQGFDLFFNSRKLFEAFAELRFSLLSASQFLGPESNLSL